MNNNTTLSNEEKAAFFEEIRIQNEYMLQQHKEKLEEEVSSLCMLYFILWHHLQYGILVSTPIAIVDDKCNTVKSC
jgi:hypothetical protein